MNQRTKSDANAWPICFLLPDALNPNVGLAGATVTMTVCKHGSSSYSAASGAVSEVDGGTYRWNCNATDLNTEGPLLWRATAPGAVTQDGVVEVGVDLRRIEGLMGKNAVRVITYDASSTATGQTWWLYDTAAHAALYPSTTGRIGIYTETVAFSGGLPTTFTSVETS